MIGALVMAVVLAGEAPLEDARAEARAQALMREIRCVVCENEPVSQSTAEIAVDMRRSIRQQVQSGASDAEVRGFFTERYGQFVLFRPATDGAGLLLWAFPFVLLGGVGAWLAARAFGRRKADLAPIPDDRGETPP